MAKTCNPLTLLLSSTETDAQSRNADYTIVWNVLDCPALAFPVTTVDPVLDASKRAHEFLSDDDIAIYEMCKITYRIVIYLP